MKPIYLCGPIQGRPDSECVDWRQRAVTLLAPLQVLDPIRRDYRNVPTTKAASDQIVAWDEEDIRESAALLVMFDKPSVGTAMEIRMAAKEVRIPVYTIDISGASRSPWLVHHTTKFFVSLEAACEFIKSTHG